MTPEDKREPERPDLEAIESRAGAATAGPWTWEGTDLNGGRQIQGGIDDAEMSPILVPFVCAPCDKRKATCLGPNEPDSAFIVSARTDVPALVAYARRLERALMDYGCHVHQQAKRTMCERVKGGYFICTCGLNDILKPIMDAIPEISPHGMPGEERKA